MSDQPTPKPPQPEPWMRGPLPDVDPLVAPVFYSFTQVREDLAAHTAGISDEQAWASPHGLPSLGFHLRHIAGSVERLVAYLMEEQLTAEQIAFLKAESTPGPGLADLLAEVDRALTAAEERIRTIAPAAIHEPRYIGRKRLPTSVLGLLTHVAEHTQRHLGQAITTAKLVRAAS